MSWELVDGLIADDEFDGACREDTIIKVARSPKK